MGPVAHLEEYPFTVARHPRTDEETSLACLFVQDRVCFRIGAELVILDHGQAGAVLGMRGIGRRQVGINKAGIIRQPGRIGILRAVDHLARQVVSAFDVLDVKRRLIGVIGPQGVGQQLAIERRGSRAQGDIRRADKRVRIEKHVLRRIGIDGRAPVEDAFFLLRLALRVEVTIAGAVGSAHRVDAQKLGVSLRQCGAAGHGVQVAAGEIVLRRYPRLHFRRLLVFKPAIGIVHLRPEINIRNIDRACRRIMKRQFGDGRMSDGGSWHTGFG